MSHSFGSSRRRQLWKVSGESSIWRNYPTKPIPDKLSRLFVIESEDVTKYEFVCCSFNKNGTKLATMDHRGNIHEFDFKTFKCQTVSRCGVSGDAITYSPKYNDIAVALNNKEIRIFECGQYKLSAKIKTHHQDTICQLQYMITDHRFILMSCSADKVIIWDLNKNCQQLQSLSHNHSIVFGLISPSFEAIVTCFANDVVSFWDWNDYSEKYELFYSNKQKLKQSIGHRHLKLICGDVEHKNGLLVVGGRGRYIYLWIIAKKLLLKCIVLPPTIKHVIQLKFLQNHALNIILALGDDGQIVAINHKTLDIEFYIQRSSQFIQSFAISNHNKTIACAMSDGTIEIMSIKSLCKQYKPFQRNSKCEPEINSVAAHPSQLSSLKGLCESELQNTNVTTTSSHFIPDITCPVNAAISSRLSVDKLRDYLSANGSYAHKYRLIVWRFLLHLPNLETVYTHYQNKSSNKKCANELNINCNIHLRSQQRLRRMLSLLSNWCALCAHIEFLPSFIAPFTNLYQKNDMECFECIMFILCKYCSEWFVDYPNPPINILSFWISAIKYFDNALYQHFKHHSIYIEHHLWQIICNGFSLFFNETDWLLIWDHIVTNTPLFFHVLPVSILFCCKNALFAMHSKKDVATFFEHQQQMYTKNIIDKAYFIMRNVPQSSVPTFNSVTNPIVDKEAEQYPIFDRYPVQSLALMQQQYTRNVETKQSDKQHEKLLKALQAESEKIAAKQAQFAQEQRMMDYLYKQRVSALQFEEQQHALKQKEKSDQITEKRLESLGNIQQTMKEMLDQQNVLKQLTINDVENQILHHKKISKIENDRFKNSAALNQLESDLESKMYSMQLEQSIKSQTLKLQRLKHEFDKEQKLKHQLLEQTLTTKDDASKYKFIQQKRLLTAMNKIQNEYDTEQCIKHKLKLESLVNDQRNKEIQEENEMTDLMNEQLNITQNMIQKQKQLQDILTNQEEFEMDIMTDQYHKFKENIKENHQNVMQTHKKELLTKLNEQQSKINALSKQQRLKQFESVLKDQRKQIQSNLSHKDQQLQQTIDLLQNQIKHSHEKQMELERTHKEILEENAFGRIAKDAETQIMNEEKEKYATIREKMLKGMHEKEQCLRERHDAMMSNLMKDREKQLLSIGQNAKDSVSNQEMAELERQYQIKQKELKKLQQSYNARQDKIRHQILEESNIQNTDALNE